MANGSASPLAIHLFGPFEVRLHGSPLPRLRSRKGQWLLAVLTLRAGCDVERDWLVATPVLGSLGTVDTSGTAKKNVVSLTRSGTLSVYSTPASACSPSSWPNFHHDMANSGDYTRDAIAPGVPMHLAVSGGALNWTAPGGDLMCGRATSYEIVTSPNPITAQNFSSATPLAGAPTPGQAGTPQSYPLPRSAQLYVAVRAIDEQGNIGLPAVKRR